MEWHHTSEHKQLLHVRPTALAFGLQHLWHEHAVRDQFQPREGETGQAQRLKCKERAGEGAEDLRPDEVEHRIRNVELKEEGAEDSQKGALVEILP